MIVCLLCFYSSQGHAVPRSCGWLLACLKRLRVFLTTNIWVAGRLTRCSAGVAAEHCDDTLFFLLSKGVVTCQEREATVDAPDHGCNDSSRRRVRFCGHEKQCGWRTFIYGCPLSCEYLIRPLPLPPPPPQPPLGNPTVPILQLPPGAALQYIYSQRFTERRSSCRRATRCGLPWTLPSWVSPCLLPSRDRGRAPTLLWPTGPSGISGSAAACPSRPKGRSTTSRSPSRCWNSRFVCCSAAGLGEGGMWGGGCSYFACVMAVSWLTRRSLEGAGQGARREGMGGGEGGGALPKGVCEDGEFAETILFCWHPFAVCRRRWGD